MNENEIEFQMSFLPTKERKPTKEEAMKGIKRVIEKFELFEISAVAVPPNPYCIIGGLNKWGRFKYWISQLLLWLRKG